MIVRADLSQELAEAQATIEALLRGQIDAVADPTGGTPVLLAKAQEALRESESNLRRERDRAQRYLDTAEVILLALDLEGRITLVNRYACAMLGWTQSELIGRDFIETCVPTALREDARQHLAHALDGPDSSRFKNAVITKAGEERMIEWRNTLQRDEAGRVVSTISSGTDITARSQAVSALQAAEARMWFAVTVAGVGIWDLDYATGAHEWSEILEAHYGLEAGTFDGTFDAFAERIHPDDRAPVMEIIAKALTTGGDFSYQHRATWPDGSVHWLTGAGRVLLGPQGEPIRAIGITLDVTERRKLEEQYQQAQKMEAVGRLAGGIAHDFNNLLMIISGFAAILLDGLIPSDPRRDDLDQISKAADSAATLTRQLLVFSRQQVIEPKIIVLEEAVESSTRMLQRLIGEDIDLVTILNPAMTTVCIDPGQLEQVILNLAVNARDAMPTGGKLTIETSVVELTEEAAREHWPVKAGRFAMIRVADTGMGMDEKTRARIFEPFFTTKGQGKGTGLGLATVYGIVTQSDGFISVLSAPQRGAMFQVYLPIPGDEAVSSQSVVINERTPRGGETILLVEDSDGVRDIAHRALERQGYTVLEAPSAAAALDLARAFPGEIHLLLTDVVMPEMSGRVLSEQFALERPESKLLFMSGYTDDAVVRHGVLRAKTPYLQKPFSPHMLGTRVREILDA